MHPFDGLCALQTNEAPSRDLTTTPNYLNNGANGRFHYFNPFPTNNNLPFVDSTQPVKYDAFNELGTQYTVDATTGGVSVV